MPISTALEMNSIRARIAVGHTRWLSAITTLTDALQETDFQTKNTVAKEANGNLITVPGDFKVLTSEGTKVTDGIVIQDREGNEFVWVPVDSVNSNYANKPRVDNLQYNTGTSGDKVCNVLDMCGSYREWTTEHLKSYDHLGIIRVCTIFCVI